MFRQMLDGISAPSAVQQLRHEGLRYLYRGMLPPMLQKTITLSIMFGVYDEVRRPLQTIGVNEYSAKVVAGLCAGTTEGLMLPFERVQTLLADSTHHSRFKNTFAVFRVIAMNYGFKEFYRGLVPVFIRNGPSNVCFFVSREEVKKLFPKSNYWFYRNFYEFMSGALIGAIISTIFYPLNVAKVAMQSQLGGPYQNVLYMFKKVYNERGRNLKCFYSGVQMNCFRAFISWGIMNTAYENFKRFIY